MQLLFVSPVNYYALEQRHQAIARILIKEGFDVIYLNPVSTFGLSCIKDLKSSAVNIKIPFKASSYPFFQNICSRLCLNMLLKRIKLTPSYTILWISEPSHSFFCRLDWRFKVYDKCDMHGFFPGQSLKLWQIYESEIIKKSNLILASNEYIYNNINQPQKTLLVKNAVSKVFPKNEITISGRINALSAGAHFEWIDMDWLELLANTPEVFLNIAGPGRGEKFKQLIKHKGVKYHGILSRTELETLMQKMHVGLVPFKDIELTKGVDPVKVYDYAAFGLEIWSTNIDSMRANNLIDKFCTNIIDIRNACTQLLHKKHVSKSRKQVPLWTDRLEPVITLLKKNRSLMHE